MTAEWLVKKLNGKGKIVLITGVPGTSVDTLRTKAAKEVFAKNPDIKIVAEAVGMWSQAVARTELSKILATHNWNDIDGLWMQVGCFTANSMQLEAGKKPTELLPCAGEGSNGGRIQMLPADAKVEGGDCPYCADERPAHLLCLAALLGRAGAEARGREARGQGCAEADDAAAAARHQPEHQILRDRFVGGNEGRLQCLSTGTRSESGLVCLDLLGTDAGDRLRARSSVSLNHKRRARPHS